MSYRLGLDIGTNSIGWCILEGNTILATGARIFSDGRDPKSGASLAEDRRLARGMRRRRDRYLRRRGVLLSEMIDAGLMPTDASARKALETLDPYALRVRALDEKLEPGEIGRALFHLNQRRGFKSNRKTAKKDAEDGKIRTGVKSLHAAMDEREARTFGEFLRMRQGDGETARARLKADEGEYDFYPDRALLEDEFTQIWSVQASHHPDLLTDELHDRLFQVVFFQRPLRAPKVGRCLYLDEDRIPKRHPLFQQRRMYETVNQLRIARTGGAERELTLEERNLLIGRLKSRKKVAFKTLANVIKLDAEESFTLESERRKDMEGDEIRAVLGDKKRFGPRWETFDLNQQWAIVERLHETEEENVVLAWLTDEFGIEGEQAAAIADSPLPEGYGRIGLTATREILAELEKDVISYDKAVVRAPSLKHHSDFRTGEIADALPYYAEVLDKHVLPGTSDPVDDVVTRFGRLTNPTVHIGLGQLRRLVNTLIDRYGKPEEIIVELARDLKMNERQRKENDKRLNETTKAAQERSKKLIENDIPDTGANRLRMRLWEDLNPSNMLDRRCVYTGEQIGIRRLFSEEVEVDHILPYSRTLDDSPANKMLIMREANRRKRNRAPFEAFGDSEDWAAIAERASRLPKNMRWRFAADAMEKFELNGGFEARQLVDTQYLSRLAKQYFGILYHPDEQSKVRVIPGRLTEMLRRHWGLNSILPDHNYAEPGKKKNRLDHRHHAIDAAVIAATDRGLLQKISRAAALNESKELDDIVGRIEPPWPTFRDDLRAQVNAIVVSHKADHGKPSKAGAAQGRDTTTGRLHNDTAYGLTNETDEKGKPLVVRRVTLGALTPKQVANIRDPLLRDAIWEATEGLTGKDREKALRDFAAKHPLYKGIRRARVLEPTSVIPIHDKAGNVYKGVKGDSNQHYEVWQLPNGKWVANVVSTFDANSPDTSRDGRPHPAAKKIMRLHQNDLVAYQEGDQRIISRVVKFNVNGQLIVAEHNQAGNLKQRDTANSEEDPFKYKYFSGSSLKTNGGRKIRIDDSGRIFDPGSPKP